VRLTRAHLIGLGVLLGLAVLAYVLFLKPPPPPEELIRQKVVKMVAAAQEKKLGGVLEEISPRFRTSDGMNKDELRGFLAGQLFRGTWVRIFTVDLDVQVKSATSAEFTGKFIFGRSDAKVLKDLAKDSVLSSYQITATAELEPDGEWRFVSARYQEIDPTQFL